MANNTNKHTEPCTEVELLKKDVDYLAKAVEKLEKNEEEQDSSLKNLEMDMQDVKNVNTFLLKEVKEIIDVKNKINAIILKYVSKVFFTVFIIGALVLLIQYKDFFLKLLKID
jgi:hypothetical protein